MRGGRSQWLGKSVRELKLEQNEPSGGGLFATTCETEAFRPDRAKVAYGALVAWNIHQAETAGDGRSPGHLPVVQDRLHQRRQAVPDCLHSVSLTIEPVGRVQSEQRLQPNLSDVIWVTKETSTRHLYQSSRLPHCR